MFNTCHCVQDLLGLRLGGRPRLQGQGQVQDGEPVDRPVHEAGHFRAQGDNMIQK